MLSEETKLQMLAVFGYTPEDLNCANADTAISELFQIDMGGNPTTLVEMFINNCSEERFSELKKAIKQAYK